MGKNTSASSFHWQKSNEKEVKEEVKNIEKNREWSRKNFCMFTFRIWLRKSWAEDEWNWKQDDGSGGCYLSLYGSIIATGSQVTKDFFEENKVIASASQIVRYLFGIIIIHNRISNPLSSLKSALKCKKLSTFLWLFCWFIKSVGNFHFNCYLRILFTHFNRL